jgi:hypothetical protein
MSKGNGYSQSQEKLFHLLGQLAQQASSYQLDIAHDANDGPQLIHSLFAGDTHD